MLSTTFQPNASEHLLFAATKVRSSQEERKTSTTCEASYPDAHGRPSGCGRSAHLNATDVVRARGRDSLDEVGAHSVHSDVAGRYELQHEIARGGMGAVYRALDRKTGTVVALKRSVAQQHASSELARFMLEREYQTLVALKHPYIIQVYDFGVDDLGPYYTMELLDGADLRATSPLPWREVCAYLRDVASSLALLHSRRLLHCDVSAANIRLTSEGRAKLLDFGALASFGRNKVIAGSPPTTAPEVLERAELDQRVDLYALGATAYYALTGRHAYPASALSALPAFWAQGRPSPPSTYVAEIPRALDELVLALLDLDRMMRPASAAEVIDRLSAIANLAPDHDQQVLSSYLFTRDVVGRDAERATLEEKLRQALEGRGGAVVIEGAAGLGKSHLLEDIAHKARLSGARVLAVNARTHPAPLGSFTALVREAQLVEGTNVGSAHTPTKKVFIRCAQTRPLVLAIDELHEADSESLVAFAALARATRNQPILLVATVDATQANAERPALRLWMERATTVELRPFDADATYAFVKGLFGDIASAPRLASFLHHHGVGSPRAYMEIVQHLISQGIIRYAEGTWVLPDEPPHVGAGGLDLAAIVDAAFERRLSKFSPQLRSLALCLSPYRRVFDLELCTALARGEPELDGWSLEPLLDALVREGVLLEDRGSYAFAGARTRELLYRRLTDRQKKEKHARIADALVRLYDTQPARGFEIGFHYLLAGEDKKARAHLNRSVESSLMDMDSLIESVPDLWALLEQQRSVGASDDEVQFLEALLVTSGYYLDPGVHERIAERVLLSLHRTLGFALAARLAPWLGRPLALLVGILLATFKRAFRKPYLVSGNSVVTSLLIFVGACAAVSASACFRLDRRAHPRLRELLGLAGGLGRLDALRYLYDLFEVGADVVRGRFAAVQAGLEDQLERLPRVRFFNEQTRHQYEAGLQFFVGRNQLLRLDSTTLENAERIDALGAAHDRLMAAFLRRTYHLHRGDSSAAKREEEHFDQMAARFGSRWVADVMSVLEFLPYHLSGDVINLKRTLHRMDRLLAVAPGLKTCREIIRAMYEGHRGRHDLALSIYSSIEAELAPFACPLWAAARGHQAECLNAVGRPAEALALCEEARSHLTDADRPYVLAYQQLERESALALAQLGRTEEALSLIYSLMAECAPHDHPLVNGLLHHDRARIACLMRDREAFELHAETARRAFLSVQNPALLARARRLFEMAHSQGLIANAPGALEAARFVTHAKVMRNARADRVLKEIVRRVRPRAASLYLVLPGRMVLSAEHGQLDLPPSLEDLLGRVVEALPGEVSTTELSDAFEHVTSDIAGSQTILPLSTVRPADKRALVGVLVLDDCAHTEEVAHLEISAFASELSQQEEATEIV